MSRRTLYTVLGVAAIVGFVAFGAGAFKSNLTPYVSFDRARTATGAVQVAGKLVEHSDSFDEVAATLRFTLHDERGQRLEVSYRGMKPGNFNEATQVVAIGRYRDGVLEAEKLLVSARPSTRG